jgi:hypothetical protein
MGFEVTIRNPSVGNVCLYDDANLPNIGIRKHHKKEELQMEKHMTSKPYLNCQITQQQ